MQDTQNQIAPARARIADAERSENSLSTRNEGWQYFVCKGRLFEDDETTKYRRAMKLLSKLAQQKNAAIW